MEIDAAYARPSRLHSTRSTTSRPPRRSGASVHRMRAPTMARYAPTRRMRARCSTEDSPARTSRLIGLLSMRMSIICAAWPALIAEAKASVPPLDRPVWRTSSERRRVFFSSAVATSSSAALPMALPANDSDCRPPPWAYASGCTSATSAFIVAPCDAMPVRRKSSVSRGSGAERRSAVHSSATPASCSGLWSRYSVFHCGNSASAVRRAAACCGVSTCVAPKFEPPATAAAGGGGGAAVEEEEVMVLVVVVVVVTEGERSSRSDDDDAGVDEVGGDVADDAVAARLRVPIDQRRFTVPPRGPVPPSAVDNAERLPPPPLPTLTAAPPPSLPPSPSSPSLSAPATASASDTSMAPPAGLAAAVDAVLLKSTRKFGTPAAAAAAAARCAAFLTVIANGVASVIWLSARSKIDNDVSTGHSNSRPRSVSRLLAKLR
mmetsp:Transcript_44080/g.108218  ORF Transcript_44080/g.108218 Transcript_44080/m.108218 type:complete len:434 (-) Transcript_44080:520-1821(-)